MYAEIAIYLYTNRVVLCTTESLAYHNVAYMNADIKKTQSY